MVHKPLFLLVFISAHVRFSKKWCTPKSFIFVSDVLFSSQPFFGYPHDWKPAHPLGLGSESAASSSQARLHGPSLSHFRTNGYLWINIDLNTFIRYKDFIVYLYIYLHQYIYKNIEYIFYIDIDTHTYILYIYIFVFVENIFTYIFIYFYLFSQIHIRRIHFLDFRFISLIQ